jgi:hypothetical protein
MAADIFNAYEWSIMITLPEHGEPEDEDERSDGRKGVQGREQRNRLDDSNE